jgi:6-phosphogluconolactonase
MTELDRRRFLQMAGSASLLSAACGRLGWASAHPPAPGFLYVGAGNAIHVYSISAQQHLRELQVIASARPVAMVAGNERLYVANGVSEVGNLPRGSVEAYAINRLTGGLQWMTRVPLSLSGAYPRDLAITPDGQSMVVAIHGGGAYNVLSIEKDGRPGKVTGILKEIGSGPHPLQTAAHPSAVMFDQQGRVLTADMGADRLSTLAVVSGEIRVSSRREVAAGSGPTCMVLHPDGNHLYVVHALDGTVSSFAYGPEADLEHKRTVRTSLRTETATLAIHPTGEVLYSSHGRDLQTWKLRRDGGLEPLHSIFGLQAHTLQVTAGGESLFALSSDGVLTMSIDAATFLPGKPVLVAPLSQAESFVMV